MYDKFNEQRLISLGTFQFSSSRYEIWAGGQMIQSDNTQTAITLKTIARNSPSENGIEVNLSTLLPETTIASNLFFDVAYTSNDRILLAIIPNSSNCDGNDNFIGFVNYAPLRTRLQKNFNNNEPHACSLFFINGRLSKITFSIALSKLLIEFYI